jgi:glycosyltransferase involved in cell wall biosynthesis
MLTPKPTGALAVLPTPGEKGARENERSAAGRRLEGKHILVDGYNLELPEGTGVKHYGLGLIEALHALGGHVSVLRSCRRSRVPLVQEALLHAEAPERGSKLGYLPGAVRALLGLPTRAQEYVPTGTVIPLRRGDALGALHKVYVAPHCYRLANGLFRRVGRGVPIALPDAVDVWHATYPLPLTVRKARVVTTVHDLIPLRLPWATLDDKQFFYRLVRHVLDRSDLVVTDSECSRNDLIELFGVSPERVQVLYPAAPFAEEAIPAEALSRQLAVYGLRPGRYLLFVGAIQPRKNLGRLCQALALLRLRLPLVVVGPKGWLGEEELRWAEPLVRRGRFVLLHHVPRPHLRSLYAGARCFVFPSLYEGFGLPPLEAMAHGCPVLAAHTSSLPEVCGDAALYADPYDVDDLADKVQVLVRDEALRERLRARGRQRLAWFSPARHRDRVHEVYARVLA